MTRKLTIGLVHNWPGKKNSELDIIGRMRPLLQSRGHTVLVIDPLGYVLGDNAERQSDEPITDGACDAVINLHYLNPRFFSGLSYAVNWNPIDYLINDPITGAPVPREHLEYLTDCLRSHDRVLSAGSGLLDQYAETLRRDLQGRALPDATLMLHTTIAATGHGAESESVAGPGPDTFSVFYIGMNWEKLSTAPDRKVRHEGLLELLDQSGRFRFFGLRNQGGRFLWEGFSHYQGELPFDGGNSIIEQSRRCGVALVLSSPQHRRSAVVSTRLFQACAAGTVVISDDNPFIRQHFGDTVLYFDYGADNQQTAGNILAKVTWIEQNWRQAREMAARARDIFVQRFALEQETALLCEQLEKDMASRAATLNALASRAVAVHCLLSHVDQPGVRELLDNISRQSHKNITVYLHPDPAARPPLQTLLDGMATNFPIKLCELAGGNVTVGATLSAAAEGPEDYHLWYSTGFDWRRDHVANLLAVCEQDRCELAYSPYFAAYDNLVDDIDDTMRFFITGMNGGYSRLTPDAIAQLSRRDLPLGNLLVRAEALRRALPRLPVVELFDLGALSLVIRALYEENPQTIGFSAVISALHAATRGMAHRTPYNEYDHLDERRRQGDVRDRHLFAALRAGGAVLSGVAGKYQQNFASDDPLEVSTLISRNFSYSMYIQHVLRNQPLLRRGFDGLHRLLARLLKS